ncbi:hypothetical protein CALVIDRAFT_556951 [Calocera viscosa TUFC12733]|uniref:Uncharacterized protein n=1 Tax=Calocera viscosa (strain TUFC12733) TaxID=1330018 RepID=A0A167JDZ7_CALVF|nr:hypothetical protein CALVIDRAFT_556951 [Calocera viscosa TUFC12733]
MHCPQTAVLAILAMLIASAVAIPLPPTPDHDPVGPQEDAWCGYEHCDYYNNVDYRSEDLSCRCRRGEVSLQLMRIATGHLAKDTEKHQESTTSEHSPHTLKDCLFKLSEGVEVIAGQS